MQTNVIIVHGSYGYPEENWFGWLQQEIQNFNIACLVPHFPTPLGQNLNSWLNVFHEKCSLQFSEKSILIGHSLGALFCLRLLEKIKFQISLLILVGLFTETVNIKKFDDINRSFIRDAYSWSQIVGKTKRILCFYGEDDPYISNSHSRNVCSKLNTARRLISKAGHINLASGYDQFPLLLFYIREFLDSQVDKI